MAFHLGPSICVILTVFIFFLSLLSFVGVPKFNIAQDKSRLLGRDENKSDSALFFTTLLMAITCYLASRWTAHPPTTRKLQTYFISDDSAPVSAYYFNRHLVIYTFITTFTIFAVIVLELGSGGRIKNISLYGIILSYVFLIYCGGLLIDWPYDAVWFKIQGLCFDYALMITFIRIYFNTKHELKHGDGAERMPLANDEAESDDHAHDQQYGLVHHPCQLLILVFASFIHNVGNLIAAVSFEDLMPTILSALTYAITYPAYMYYVYVDTHSTSIYPTKRIYLPSTPGWKKFVVATISICCSLLTARLGAFLMSRNNQKGDGNFSDIYY
ncbi:6698_t:CDS:2 [Gigaspora rosea]|nr:6698_t:CDS:2 [Gigaspora rosea]